MAIKELKRYKTKPLESWGKLRDIRLNHYRKFITAKEEGKLIGTGGIGWAQLLTQGIDNCLFLGGEPYGASIGGDKAVAVEYMEACESRGFARDLDSYMRCYWGSMYLDKYYFGGPFPRPDFIFTFHSCDSHMKWYQVVAEYYGVPMFGIDQVGTGALSDRVESRAEYLEGQVHDAIEWLEKITGRKFNDEKFIEALTNQSETEAAWGDINILNQAIPAPLDEKALFALYLPAFEFHYLAESARWCREMAEEVRWRIQEGIAAWPYEQARILHDSQPPWHWMRLFRLMEQYGAVCVGSHYGSCSGSNYSIDENGIWHAPQTLRQKGIVLQSREQAVHYLAQKQMKRIIFSSFCGVPTDKSRQLKQMVEQWHADGVLFHLNRGCEGLAQLQLENRLALIQAGISVGTYEGNMADFREFDEAQTVDRIESFMESMGLTKLNI